MELEAKKDRAFSHPCRNRHLSNFDNVAMCLAFYGLPEEIEAIYLMIMIKD